jgi:hypothetical protein
MAPKKKAIKSAPASKEPVRRSGSKKAGRPTRAEKKARNKALYKEVWEEAKNEIRLLRPPVDPTVVHGATPKPSKYDAKLAQKICIMFATDPNMTLMSLNSNPGMPTVWHFYEWLQEHPEFDKAYTRAREIQTDLQAAEMERWSREPLIGTKTIIRTKSSDHGDEESKDIQEYDNVERAKLMINTRQWLLAKYRPRKYGVQAISLEGATSADDALQELLSQFKARSQEIENA